MKTVDLLEYFGKMLAEASQQAAASGVDSPIALSRGERLSTIGTLHLYTFEVPPETRVGEDVPVSILLPSDLEPAEGFTVGRHRDRVFLQTLEVVGQDLESATLVPDASGWLTMASHRLAEMAKHPEKYTLGPADRLLPWLDPDLEGKDQPARAASGSSVLSTLWTEDQTARRTTLAAQVVEQVRANKRLLVISPTHRQADEAAGGIARALRGAGLPFKSLVSRYEIPVLGEAGGMALTELGFEAQMHRFYAKSRADKATLRRKYERFRELTPLLAYKGEKLRDLNEVKLLEWRLLTKVSELQGKIKEIDKTLAEYEAIPIWKRLAMQTIGKNVATLGEYKVLYQAQIQGLMRELEVAQRRIEELSPEAAIPKDLRPEYSELKDEIKRLGGTRKIREMLAAEEGTNRQAFIQNRRVVVTTAARVATDPVFDRVRFDILLADEATHIPAPLLLAAAGLVRERIVLSGDSRDIPAPQAWAFADALAGAVPKSSASSQPPAQPSSAGSPLRAPG